MSPQCETAVAQVGNGIGASLRGVDCLVSDVTAGAFGRLFGTDGALVPALTVILTIYVAFFAYSLITGRSRIGIGALTPRMMTIGLVLTFVTSWAAYSNVVWNLAIGAPDEIASLLTGTKGSATNVFGDKIDIVLAAVQETTSQASQQNAQAGQAGGQDISTFSPQGLMWLGATLLLLGTVGVLVTSRIALAVLVALGPVFIVLALFPGTRGLFAGWLRGVVMLAVTPLFAVLGGTLMLELAVPVIGALGAVPGTIDPRAAMAFFMVGAVHVALMILVLKVSATMVGSWTVFGFGAPRTRERDAAPSPAPQTAQVNIEQQAIAGQAASAGQRRIAIAGIPAGIAANDAAPAGYSTVTHDTRVHNIGGGGPAGPGSAATSRARGVGSRFRSPNNSKLARSSERLS